MKKNWQRRDFIRTSALTGLSLGLFGSLGLKASASNSKITKVVAGKRIGIIGLDTSHSPAFVKSFNGPDSDTKYKGYRVVAAYPYGSREIESSYKRIPAFTEDVKSKGVEIVNSIQELLAKVDVVLLETNDGRLHKAQALEVINAGKPMFIDKPIANSLQEAHDIFEAARKNNVPVFSSSSLRFAKGTQEIRNGKVGKVMGADVFSPSPLEPTHTDFYWYGIHGVEMLFTVMGAGCESVKRYYTPGMDVVVGKWKDGRIGTFRGIREPEKARNYGGFAYGEKGTTEVDGKYNYDMLVSQLINFFETGKPPVPEEETLDICAFIDAAQKSRKKNGKTIRLSDFYKKIK